MKLIITRDRWLRGEAPSALVRGSDLKMCCLGFLCKQLGVPERDMVNTGLPEALWDSELGEGTPQELPEWLVEESRTGMPMADVQQIADVNDNLLLADEIREVTLTELFAKHDIEVEFVDAS